MHAFDVLGDPVRRRILELLLDGPRTSGQVVAVVRDEFGISQSAVSQHLRVLRLSGFADVTVDGARRIYRLQSGPLSDVDAWLGRFRRLWAPRLDALALEVARGKKHQQNSITDPTTDGKMTVDAALQQLEALGDERTRNLNARNGAGEQQYGVKLGAIRTLAKSIKTDHPLALALWHTGIIDAQLLAILLMKPRLLSADQLEDLVRSITWDRVADWMNAYVVKKHPDRETLRERWMDDPHPMVARAGWSLTADRLVKQPEGLDVTTLLDRVESTLATAAPEAQWTMNTVLAEIGIHFPDHRERAICIGDAVGLYRDYPTSRGCTSPFAPEWIREMVSRQEGATGA